MRNRVLNEVLKNTKTKIYPDGSLSTIYVNQPIFRDKNYIEKNAVAIERDREQTEKLFDLNREVPEDMSEDVSDSVSAAPAFSSPSGSDRLRDDSLKRAKDKVYDIIRLNSWSYFVTFTFDTTIVDSKDVSAVKKKLIHWLNNQVKRKGLKYILIPEKHKKGGIHLHGFINDSLSISDSGTVRCKGLKKPVRIATAEKKGLKVLSPVFNIDDWRLGFTTAIPTDNSSAFAYYCTKYITKDSDKIFGKYYYSGGDLVREPYILYTNTDFDSVPKNAIRKPHTSVQYKYQSNFNVPDWEDIYNRFDNFNDLLEFVYSKDYRDFIEKGSAQNVIQ